MLESITINNLKHTLNIIIKNSHPNIEDEFKLLETVKITYDDVLNQIVFLLIKKEYETYSEKKSLRQHIENKHGKGSYDELRWTYYGAYKFIKKHKTCTYNSLKDNLNIEIPELLPKNIQTIDEKIEGILLTDVQFSELCMYVGYQQNELLEEIHLLKKEHGKQIGSSKKVSEDNFIRYFNQYNDYIKNCIKKIDSDEKIIEKTIEYYQLEKSYSIDLSYKITEEAMKKNIKSFSENQINNIRMLIAPSINIPPIEWYPYNISYCENCMLLTKFNYIKDIFTKDDIWWFFQTSAFYTSYRMINIILNAEKIDQLIKLVHTNISLEEKASFILNYYWLFESHENYDWPSSKKIKLYRKLKNQLSTCIK